LTGKSTAFFAKDKAKAPKLRPAAHHTA